MKKLFFILFGSVMFSACSGISNHTRGVVIWQEQNAVGVDTTFDGVVDVSASLPAGVVCNFGDTLAVRLTEGFLFGHSMGVARFANPLLKDDR